MSDDVQQVRSFEHPGEGRRRAKSTPKGRQVDPYAAHEIELLLGDRPRRRDLLIEHLHLIEDTYRQISAAHLAALADEMKLSFAEVFETATFYAHFDVVKEGEPNIPPLTIRVCDSLTCAMLGAEKLLGELRAARPRRARGARSLRRALRHCAGCGSRSSLRRSRHRRERARGGEGRRYPRASAEICRLRRLCCAGRLPTAGAPALGPTCQGRPAQIARRRFIARPRRCRLSHRTQMARGARRARTAADGDQRRRGRARYLQGSPLSRNRSASFSSRVC